MKWKTGKDGFTLVEVLIATFIFLILSTIMLLFFMQGSNTSLMVSSQSDLRSIGRNALDYMTQEMRSTSVSNVIIPAAPNNTSITFFIPKDIDGNGSIINSAGITEWDTSGGQLRRTSQGVTRVLATDVSSIQFENKSMDSSLGDSEIKVTLTLSRRVLQGRMVSVPLVYIIKLRN